MVDQLQVALVGRHLRFHAGLHVVKHLVGVRHNHVHRPLTHPHLGGRGLRGLQKTRSRGRGQRRFTLIRDRLQQLHGRLFRRAADVAGPHIVVIRENARNLPIQVDPLHPIRLAFLVRIARQVSLLPVRQRRHLFGRYRGRRHRCILLAEVGIRIAAISPGVQRRQHVAAVRPRPHPYVEGNPFRRLLRRARSAHLRRGLPPGTQLLRRKTLHPRMRKNRRQGRRKSEAIRDHILRARHPEVFPEILIAVQHLPQNRFRARQVHIPLFHRRPGRKPSPRRDILRQTRVIVRVVLLH